MCKDKKISSLQNEIKELHTKLLETENMKVSNSFYNLLNFINIHMYML